MGADPTPPVSRTTGLQLIPQVILRGPLRHRNFRLFWLGFAISNLGTWIQTFALGWLVVELAVRDGSPQLAPLYLGLVGLARAVPGFGLGLIAGAVADRSNGRRVLVLTQLGAAGVSTALAALTATGNIGVSGVLLLTAIGAAVTAFEGPTRLTMVTGLVQDRELMSAVGVSQLAVQVPQIVGPALGGILLLPLHLDGLFLVTAATYAVAAVTLRQLPPLSLARAVNSVPIYRSIVEGLRYVLHDPVLRSVIVLSAVVAFCSRPYTFLIPAFAVAILDTDGQGVSVLMSATGLGALFGGLAVASLGGVWRRGVLLLGVAVAMGAALMTVAFQHALVPAIAATMALGVTMVIFSGIANIILQTGSHENIRGRVMSIFTMVFLGFMPLGQLVQGALGSVIGIDLVFQAGGVLTVAAALLVLRGRAIVGLVARGSDQPIFGRDTAEARLTAGDQPTR